MSTSKGEELLLFMHHFPQHNVYNYIKLINMNGQVVNHKEPKKNIAYYIAITNNNYNTKNIILESN